VKHLCSTGIAQGGVQCADPLGREWLHTLLAECCFAWQRQHSKRVAMQVPRHSRNKQKRFGEIEQHKNKQK
jgi:hypothetical protein